ncbi:MAG: hypothetical protein KAG66_05885, partial [Methylococcales bacterium]|nr:hypothetical protein [Methylococcales bacterium]
YLKFRSSKKRTLYYPALFEQALGNNHHKYYPVIPYMVSSDIARQEAQKTGTGMRSYIRPIDGLFKKPWP